MFKMHHDLGEDLLVRCLDMSCMCSLWIWTIRKTMYRKIKDGNPSIKSTRQMKARVDTTQRKNNESQQSTKNKENKTLCKYDPRLRNDDQW